MTALIQARELSYSLGTKLLFDQLSLAINRGDRIGLVGHNGAGKTSLLKLLAGEAQADAGEITRRRDLQVAVVEQFVPSALRELSLHQAVLSVLPEDQRLDYQADAILSALGFTAEQMATPVEQLSGGQQNLALLARAQISQPDVLLMDEPGNHMDVSAMAALRRFLDQTRLTYVMISHDRDLLDDCCSRTVFLRLGLVLVLVAAVGPFTAIIRGKKCVFCDFFCEFYDANF